MKQIFFSALGVSVLLLPSLGFASDTISGPVDDDLRFRDGVVLEGATGPSDTDAATGSTAVTLEGVGTITVWNARLGDFPRLMISGGTTVTSTRSWNASDLRKEWWDGKLVAPANGISPRVVDISFASSGLQRGDGLVVLDTFLWGLVNESFKFSPAAGVAFPVTESDGTRVWVARPGAGDKWSISGGDFCVVKNQVCSLEVSEASSLTLVKEIYSDCPSVDVANGKFGGEPGCVVMCDRGYELGDDGESCVSLSGDEIDDVGSLDDGFFGDSLGDSSIGADAVAVRPGYIKYRGSRDQLDGVVSEEGLKGAALVDAQRYNARLRDKVGDDDSDLKNHLRMEHGGGSDDEGFLGYILSMRNQFGVGASSNVFSEKVVGSEDLEVYGDGVEGGDVEVEGVSGGEDDMRESAPLLPSTGPEMFGLLALLGVGLMVFSMMAGRRG